MVSSHERTNNHPIYAVDTELGSSIFFNDFYIEEDLPVVDEQKEDKEFSNRKEALKQKQRVDGVWIIYFNGSISNEGDGTCVWIISLDR